MTFLLIALLFFLAWRTTATGLRMRRKEHEAQQAQQARQALWAAGKQDVERQQQSKHGQRRTARKLQLELSGAASPSQQPRAVAAAPNPKQLAASSTETEWQIAAAAAAAAAGSSEPTAAAAAAGGADGPGTPLRVQAGAAALRSSPEAPAAGQGRLGQPLPEQRAPAAAHDTASAAKGASQSGSLPMHVPQLPLTHPSTGSGNSLERSGGAAAPLTGRSLVPASPAPADLVAAASSSRGTTGPVGSPASQAGTASSAGSASDGSTCGGSDSETGRELPARQPSWLSAPLMLDGVLDPPSSRSSPGPSHWGLLASTDVATGERRSGRRARRQQRRQLQQRGQSGCSEAPGQSQPQPSEPAVAQIAQRAGVASQLDHSSEGAQLAEGNGVLQVRMRAAWGARLLCPRWPRWRA